METDVVVRAYGTHDVAAMMKIWNDVVHAGMAFPQVVPLADKREADAFFHGQTRSAVALIDDTVVGLYVLHPNNVGRCRHIANASYAVDASLRGQGIGRALVQNSLECLRPLGFRGLQFNAVVASNAGAIHLYESMGFTRVGTIPGGFRTIEEVYEDIYIYYHDAL